MENVPESATTDWNTAVATMNAYLTDYGWHYEIDGDNITLAEGNAE